MIILLSFNTPPSGFITEWARLLTFNFIKQWVTANLPRQRCWCYSRHRVTKLPPARPITDTDELLRVICLTEHTSFPVWPGLTHFPYLPLIPSLSLSHTLSGVNPRLWSVVWTFWLIDCFLEQESACPLTDTPDCVKSCNGHAAGRQEFLCQSAK